MNRVVSVRWRTADPLTYARITDLEVSRNSKVIIQTDKGQELGWVVGKPQDLVFTQPEEQRLAMVVRKATAADLERRERLREKEDTAFVLSRKKSRELQLGMKIIEAHYTFDQSRLIVSFGAEGRVDFRPLLQALGFALRCRVEMRQVGDRDVAKITGGLGRCGRTLCCSTWLTKFDAISIRMAKEQALPISAEGLAGACGRLRCCLRYEYEQYRAVNKAMPRIGEEVNTPKGMATVIVGHRIRETVSVRHPDEQVLEWPLSDLQRLPNSKN